MTIRFIHASDFHLDRPFKGLNQLPDSLYQRIINAPFQALHKMVSAAIESDVDFVVISGDLFDGTTPSLRAEQRFIKEVKRLANFDIPLYLIHGNHDPLDERRTRLEQAGLFIFADHVEVKRFEKEGKPTVHLYGFSYPTRHVTEPMIPFYKKKEGADYHVGLLHGYLYGNGEHDAYAPFTMQDLIEKEFDYWALGHIHQRQQLAMDQPIYYAGTPQGLSFKERGDKGVQIVTLKEHSCDVSFLSTADFLFDTLTLNISDIHEIRSLIQVVLNKKKEWQAKEQAGFLRLNLVGKSDLHQALQDPHLQNELLEVFQDGEEEEAHFCWITEISGETLPFYPREQWVKESHFLGDLLRVVNRTERLDPYIEELFNHSKGKRYLESLSSEDVSSILREAEHYLVRELMDVQKG